MYDYYEPIPEPGMYDDSYLAEFLIVMMVIYGLAFLISLIPYIFHSIGLYSIANRRGIKRPWMAWVPLLKMWTLGSISDQYQYVTKGKVHNRRKTLVGLDLTMIISIVLLMVMAVGAVVRVVTVESSNLGALEGMDLAMDMMNIFYGLQALYFVILVVAVITSVFQYVSYFDLFASCNPDKGPTLLVVSILLSFTMPYLVFFNRKKDLGMPPRKSQQAIEEAPQASDAQAAPEQAPGAEEPAAQEPAAEESVAQAPAEEVQEEEAAE